MGLDIFVIKPCHKRGENVETTENKKLIDAFPQYVVEEDDEILDWDSFGHPEFNNNEYWETHSWIRSPRDNKFYVTNNAPGITCGYYDPDLEAIKEHLILEVLEENIPTKLVKVKILPYKEVGYQRKGANQKFYEDGIWGDEEKSIILTREDLNHYYKEYFSKNVDSKGGWGSFTEYEFSDEEMSKRFKKNIMSKFIEGETAVVFW